MLGVFAGIIFLTSDFVVNTSSLRVPQEPHSKQLICHLGYWAPHLEQEKMV